MIATTLRRVVPARFRPIGYLTHLVRRRTGDRVRRGPFAGMQYIDTSIGSAHLPKLLGTYERELNGAIESLLQERPNPTLVLGAAEGYYAVGLALRNRNGDVIAFEKDAQGRNSLEKMARLNRVEQRLQIFGECHPDTLQAALSRSNDGDNIGDERPLVLCDVEGAEESLLDPSTVPALRSAFIIAEMHEFVRRGITGKIMARFGASHEIEQIWQTRRAVKDFPFRTPATWLLPRSYLNWAVSEWRPERMCWLSMKPLG